MRYALLHFVLLWSLLAAFGDEKPTSLLDARAQIEANLRTREGKAYDEVMGKDFSENHLQAIKQCKEKAGKDLESFWILLKLDRNGAVMEVLLHPTTKIGECARDTLLNARFSPPPKPGYWVGVYMKLTR